MATDKTTLKNWFKNKLKPAQEHFWAWIDSYWHKSEQIPTSSIQGLDEMLANAATTAEFSNLASTVNTAIANKVDKLEGKQLSGEDFTTLLKQKLEGIDMTTKLDRGNYSGTGEDLYNMLRGDEILLGKTSLETFMSIQTAAEITGGGEETTIGGKVSINSKNEVSIGNSNAEINIRDYELYLSAPGDENAYSADISFGRTNPGGIDFTGEKFNFFSDLLKIGNSTGDTKRIVIDNGNEVKPELRYGSKWQYSNDGVTFKDFADGSNYVDLTNSQTIAGEKTFTGYTTIQTDQSGALRLKNTTDFGTNLSFFYDNSDTANEFSAVTLHAGVSSRVDGNERSSFDITVKRDGVNESYAFFSDGQFRSTRLWLVAAQGTAPLRIESTTLNVNLNADLLDDHHGSYYLDLVNATGKLADANLSSNVALKNNPNNFSANQTITGTLQVTEEITAKNVHKQAVQALSGTTVTLDCNVSVNASITLAADTTLSFANLSDGMSGKILVKQDATGGHSLIVTPNYLLAEDKQIGGNSKFDKTANAVNLIKFYYIDGEFLLECNFPFVSRTLDES